MKIRFLLLFPLIIVGMIASVFFAGTAMAATYTVDTPVGGASPGGGTCIYATASDCSLEEAVAMANKDAIADTVDFEIPGFFPRWSINITTPLSITEPLTIDGYTQPWTSNDNSVPAPGLTDAVLNIMVDGSGLKAGENCFDINTTSPGDPVLIKGLAIGNCPLHGISLQGSNVTIQGNYIGTNHSGITAAPNLGSGIYVDKANSILIGGPNPEHRNVISGNTISGIEFTDTVDGSDIEGNFIGLDATGSAALGNGDFGVTMGNFLVSMAISGNNVGNGPSDVGNGKRNYIAGNASTGIYVAGAYTTKAYGWVQISNNYIGTDVTGTVAVPNGKGGVSIDISDDVRIEDNLISGNTGAGVKVEGDDKLAVPSNRVAIYSNYIGTDASGTNPLGNTEEGVLFRNGANRCYIGDDTVAGSGNVIAYNSGDGVVILEENPPFITDDNKIHMNSIFGNGELGIDIANDGVTLNDALDADNGANHFQNFPIVESVAYAGGNTTVNASLHSLPSRSGYRIEFFANDAADPSGYGEGQTYLGALTGINLDAFGNASFAFSVAGDYTFKYITATATDISQFTSEFGPMTAVDLSITKTASAATANERDNVTFTVTVSNIAGPAGASGVQVTDLVGGGFKYVSDSATAGTYNSASGVWDVGTLAFGASETLTINTYVNSCGNLVNTASITGGPFDSVTADNTAAATVTVACPPIAGGRPPSGSSGGSTEQPASEEESRQEEEVTTQKENPSEAPDKQTETAKSDDDSTTVVESAPKSTRKYCPDYVFNPQNPSAVTRFEFIKLMLELTCHQLPAQVPKGEKSFNDYPRGSSYNEQAAAALAALYYAVDEGIVSGYPDGTLKPYHPINFAEASKIVYMSANVSGDQSESNLSQLTFNYFGSEWYVKYYIFILDLTGWTEIDPAETLTATDAKKITDYLLEKYPV